VDTLLDRFLRYVKVETTAVEQTDRYPSSPGQLELGKILVAELKALGIKDAGVDEHGIVMGTVPATAPGAPMIAWISHMDTSPEFTAKNVKPVVHRNWNGKDIVLSGDPSKVICVAETKGMADLAGKTIITTDGTTLLGADDKAGVAVIMTAVAELMGKAAPQAPLTLPSPPRGERDLRTEAHLIAHGPIRIVFTCDEEVGRGVDKLDLKKIGAVCGYTLDGESIGELDNETFSADLAVVTITGRNIHPGLATGKMVNAIRLAGVFLSRMPWQRLAPETTANQDGFLHPYVIEGGVHEVKLRVLLRSFAAAELAEQAAILRRVADSILVEHPPAKIDIEVKKQYRNMREALEKEPRAVRLAAEAIRRVGLEPKFQSIRGGTDGSRLSELGLPTPNLAVGMHNFHSPLEFACLEEMETSVKILMELAQLWGREK